MKRGNLLRIVLSLILGVTGVFLYGNIAQADYPTKPVTFICVWGVGGQNDAITRTIAESMKKYFPKPLVVVNRPGAGGAIGSAEIVSAQPDGYTLGVSTMPPLTIEPHLVNLPYNTPDDYLPIALVGSTMFTLTVNSEMPYKTLKEFIEYAKSNPGKVRVGTSGIGHITSVILEELKFNAKIDLTEVPFKGGGEDIAAVLGKHVEADVLSLFEAVPLAKSGKTRALVLFDEKRSPLLPDVPTCKESGVDISRTTYTVIIGPKNLPADVVSTVQNAYKKVSEDPDFLKYMNGIGVNVKYEGTVELRKRLWSDYRENKNIFDRIGLKKK
jgi:tripartite-type tricarboxylate transporter receptor subunit TctC